MKLVGDNNIDQFHSFRLILGEVARGTAAYTGPGVYLDVALSWVVSSSAVTPIPMRNEGREGSTYSFKKLLKPSVANILALNSASGLYDL